MQKRGFYTISNANEMEVVLTDYAAGVVSILVKDKDGKRRDVILGYDDIDGYIKGDVYFGATVGRNCNRIEGAKITIDGIVYPLDDNDNGNNLHGGRKSLSMIVWDVKEQTSNKIIFACKSPDLEGGFPGNATVEVTYELTDDDTLEISFYAVADKKTIFNLTNHCYFNLNGSGNGNVLDQMLKIHAAYYTPRKSGSDIPSGEIVPVENTPFDFREEKEIGRDIKEENEQLIYARGYDHNYVIDRAEDGLTLAATAYSNESGIQLDVFTTALGVHLYTANWIGGQVGKNGVTYADQDAFCLETQYFPNSINEPNFVSPLFEAHEPFRSKTCYHFEIHK